MLNIVLRDVQESLHLTVLTTFLEMDIQSLILETRKFRSKKVKQLAPSNTTSSKAKIQKPTNFYFWFDHGDVKVAFLFFLSLKSTQNNKEIEKQRLKIPFSRKQETAKIPGPQLVEGLLKAVKIKKEGMWEQTKDRTYSKGMQ